MPPTKVILLACGSFNPPTNMHLRMFEIARDYLHRLGNYIVIGGLVSPVHDAYGKKDLVSSTHRIAMLKLALESSDWIKLSDWETKQENWSRTRVTLQYHQNLINSILNNSNNDDIDNDMFEWISQNIKNGMIGNIQIKLLCGSDLLESFGTPGLWADEDIENIVGNHGLIVITRDGCNPLRFIYESDALTRFMSNIHIVTEWITNEISSTKIRRALRRSDSVKYLIPDKVIEYIYKNGLYGARPKELKYLNLLTPSPVDVVMESPSPPSNCINLCNNNLFPTGPCPPPKTNMANNSEETFNKLNKPFRHPGQAIKILSDTAAHRLISDEVGNRSLSLDCPDDSTHSKVQKTKSLVEYIFIERKSHAKSDIEVFV